MKLVEITEATSTLAEYTAGLTDEPVIVIRDGQPVAALLTLDNIDLESLSLSSNPDFINLIERSRARQRAEGGVSSAEMRRRLGLGVA